jgi:hypothetical protein
MESEMDTLALRDLLKPFAASIFAKASAIRHFEDAESLTQFQRARFMESISDDIKKCTNFFTPRISNAAHEEALRLGINLNKMNWHSQPRFDRGRKTFHWEHMVPVKTIREECRKARKEVEVLEILMTRPCVVWILKSEDDVLTRLGYRSKRDDPIRAYQEAGIVFD